jgi:hypothetical protein
VGMGPALARPAQSAGHAAPSPGQVGQSAGCPSGQGLQGAGDGRRCRLPCPWPLPPLTKRPPVREVSRRGAAPDGSSHSETIHGQGGGQVSRPGAVPCGLSQSETIQVRYILRFKGGEYFTFRRWRIFYGAEVGYILRIPGREYSTYRR